MSRADIRIKIGTTSRSKAEEKTLQELLRRTEKLVESLGTHGGGRCERCGRAHATIDRAIRYHMARWWMMSDPIDKEREMDFIDTLRLALPPGVDVSVSMSEARSILDE